METAVAETQEAGFGTKHWFPRHLYQTEKAAKSLCFIRFLCKTGSASPDGLSGALPLTHCQSAIRTKACLFHPGMLLGRFPGVTHELR